MCQLVLLFATLCACGAPPSHSVPTPTPPALPVPNVPRVSVAYGTDLTNVPSIPERLALTGGIDGSVDVGRALCPRPFGVDPRAAPFTLLIAFEVHGGAYRLMVSVEKWKGPGTYTLGDPQQTVPSVWILPSPLPSPAGVPIRGEHGHIQIGSEALTGSIDVTGVQLAGSPAASVSVRGDWQCLTNAPWKPS